ncbi:MAG: amino acid ABC transporter permease [Actinobacteria bacterium]|nr:amino acid ABC transporter permease [Actinomycetota bacterium]
MGELILSPLRYERLLEGLSVTLQVLGLAFALGIVLSLVFGVARLSERRWVRGIALVYVEFSRGISSIILLFFMAIAIPILLGLEQRSLLVLGGVALGLNMGGYGAEIIRGAILSVPKGQTEASISLNLTDAQRLRYVILPQAMRVILPPMGNLTIEILKGTALVSLVGLADLTLALRKLDVPQPGVERVPTMVLFANVLVIYFVVAQVINGLFRLAERRTERSYGTRAPIEPVPDGVETAGAGG